MTCHPHPTPSPWKKFRNALAMAIRFDRSRLNSIAKAKKLFVSETCFRFCAIDLQNSFLALALASKKISKTISETSAKWSWFCSVSETRGLANMK